MKNGKFPVNPGPEDFKNYKFEVEMDKETGADNGETIENTEETMNVNLDVILDDKNFVDYLSKFPDAGVLDLSDENSIEIAKRYETFKKVGQMAESLKGIYSSELESEIGIAGAKFEEIDGLIYLISIEDPDKFKALSEGVSRNKALKEAVAKEKGTMAESFGLSSTEDLKNKITETKEKVDNLINERNADTVRMREIRGRFIARLFSGKLLDEEDALFESRNKKMGEIIELQELVKKMEESENNIEHLDKSSESQRESLIYSGLIPLEVYTDTMRKVVTDALIDIENSGSGEKVKGAKKEKTIDDLGGFADLLNKVMESKGYKIDNDALNKSKYEELTAKYKLELTKKIDALISRSIDLIKDTPLTIIEVGINAILAKHKFDVGAEISSEKFVVNILAEREAKEKDLSKKLMIRRLLAKYKARVSKK